MLGCRVNKNCLNWSQTYFTEKLVGLEGDKDGHSAKITSVDECTGDVDLNQRKGKIITIYDVALKLTWEGTAADGTTASGKIFVPEVAHDTDVDDYVFDVSITDATNAKQPIRDVVKKVLTPKLREAFSKFSADLIKHHGSDVYIDPSQLGTAAAPRAVHVPQKELSSATLVNSGDKSAALEAPAKKVNTTSLDETIDFQTSAHELYETLLDPQRVSIWTRSPAKISKEVGSKFELFNGNVSGELKEAVPDRKIVQSWRLQSWPAGHYSTVTLTFDQGSDSVKLNMKQTGVPIGEEELTQKNWEGYYWRSIKQAFGFGAVF
ncbi:hypothetical protein EC973_008581 [Apophysomyces ossiformis]|uniref:Activator of Hsp90 ATPase AHSA1-like N-terminal domain-containing protein n=1 Tax=Apophysomyces ossiformis TaxID=679940 RepID=A0A8H7BNC8_9FUNG|nr:hypothetical protein EC973_008581 [Apophysomyces ossiformis]